MSRKSTREEHLCFCNRTKFYSQVLFQSRKRTLKIEHLQTIARVGVDTVLCKLNANEFRRTSSIVLAKFRHNFVSLSFSLADISLTRTRFRRNVGDILRMFALARIYFIISEISLNVGGIFRKLARAKIRLSEMSATRFPQ